MKKIAIFYYIIAIFSFLVGWVDLEVDVGTYTFVWFFNCLLFIILGSTIWIIDEINKLKDLE